MKYRINHTTRYDYVEPVASCYNLAHIVPRTTQRQKCTSNRIEVNPYKSFYTTRQDYFGNQVYQFDIQQSHQYLEITAVSEVETSPQAVQQNLDFGNTCSQAIGLLKQSANSWDLLAREFLLESPLVSLDDSIREYAAPSFRNDYTLLSCVKDLTLRIYNEFTYSPASTTVSTPILKVLETRQGVCQDFAHLQIACLRSMGFPARYVSGYIETLPAPGREKLVGADASHAWVSVYSPGEGWVEFDPTNGTIATEQHIVTAWGRDYRDVTPLKGVVFGGGGKPRLKVSVHVESLF